VIDQYSRIETERAVKPDGGRTCGSLTMSVAQRQDSPLWRCGGANEEMGLFIGTSNDENEEENNYKRGEMAES
jgi:hypothetical protein